MNKKGITLIALVITIIVILILSGIVLNLVIGNNSIIKHAEIAKEKYENAEKQQQIELENLDSEIDKKVLSNRYETEKEVILNDVVADNTIIECNWKQYKYIIFYYADYKTKTLNWLSSAIYDVDTISEVQKSNENYFIQPVGYSNYYIQLVPKDNGLLVRKQNNYYLQKIVGIK